MKPKRSPPEEQVSVQSDWSIAAGEAMAASWSIGSKLAECIAAVKRSDLTWSVPFPLSELKMHPDLFLRHRERVLELLRLLRERYSPTDTIVKELAGIVDFHRDAIHGKATHDGQKKPRPSRRHPLLMNYMKDRIRKNKDMNAATLWEAFKKYSDGSPLEIRGGEAWYDEDMGRICISSRSKGGDKNITRKSFNGYFAACKKQPSRAK